MRHLDTESLGMLIAVVDNGGFTAAAERVGRTQSAVSARIAQLEENLGVRLLERSRRGIALTETGERLVAHARRMLAFESEALADLKGGTPEGSVRLGMPDDYVDAYFTPVISRFAAAYPRVEISIRCDLSKTLEPEVERGQIDVALFTRDLSRPTGELLKREKLLWLAARGHRPERQDPLPLALFPTGCRARPHIAAALDDAGLRWRVACTSSSQGGIYSAVETGLCLTAMAECAAPPEWRRLGASEGLPPLPDLEIGMLLSPNASTAARRLADTLRTALAAPSAVAAA
ncbi:LysR substrate-binding domain-containing protein [Ancylobacter defluvii]|uniref:LysR family transcriptional regulator n=1 Tax=Ancylobacter defluvii TaxID=1282440 RepID=A0A9W6JZH2_9HYPH|nr:LysR substrate-binding domain-containing protein [Ancylobacter defluvii]MBS7586696.1 LysR family transcriptional regulator [Ancylobacter defluvii]GLK85997.1 LysR family transcriptional regulator [Ancylobacter defluvii]